MPDVALEVVIIFFLLLANGFLALSEIAVVSARRTRLQQRAARGDRGAAIAIQLAESPTRFLSTVQVGITLIGTLSGAYGGATLAEELALTLVQYPTLAPYAEGLSVAVVVVLISYASVIIGELVPKRIALSGPERFASAVARPMARLSRLAAPAVSALEHTSNLIIRVFRLPEGRDVTVTEADVSAMVAAGAQTGVFAPAERQMVERVFRLDDEPIAAIMTPRREIVWLDINDPPEMRDDTIRQHPYSRFPVCDGTLDRLVGILHVRDLWVSHGTRQDPGSLRALLRQPLLVPEQSATLAVLQQFQSSPIHIAIVIDEHGGIDGLVTLNNILQFLVAAPANGQPQPDDAPLVRRSETSWLVDGALSLGDFFGGIGMDAPDPDAARTYHTVAGLVMSELGRVPTAGDQVRVGSLTLEVADMDGYRVDKVLVTRERS